MLFEHPDLLPGVDTNAIVCRQFETGSGPIDLIILDTQNGAITLVECKLAKNPEVRRKVVGQIIDYAAAMRSMPYDDFRNQWNSKAKVRLDLHEDFPDEEVAENLKLARFTLVLAVDEINEPLRQMSLYLNDKTDATTRVALIELVRFKIGDLEVLTPRTFGYEAAKNASGAYSGRKGWTREEFEEWLTANEPANLEAFVLLLQELEPLGFSWQGTKAASPSGTLRCLSGQAERFPIFFRTEGSATIELPFGNMKRFDFVENWLSVLEKIGHFDASLVRSKEFTTYPKIPLELINNPLNRELLKDACVMVQQKAN